MNSKTLSNKFQIRKASALLSDCLKTSRFSEKWFDTQGHKCTPPSLEGTSNDNDTATSALLTSARYKKYNFNFYSVKFDKLKEI